MLLGFIQPEELFEAFLDVEAIVVLRVEIDHL
jgi:hypothetical protein